MKRTASVFMLALICATPCSAFIGAVAETAKAAKDEIYQRFMMLKAVEQLKSLRDNYQASMRYYALYKKWNEGRGFLPNVAQRIGDIGEGTYREAQLQMEDDWIHSRGYGSDVDQLIGKMDDYASNKIRYAGKVFEKSRDAEREGEKIALEAASLDAKSTQKMQLKTQALQLQLAAQTNANMAQLLDVNTRMYKLQMEEKQDRLRDWDLFDKSIERLKKGTAESRRKGP